MQPQTQHREAAPNGSNTLQKTTSPHRVIFRKEGEYWTIGHTSKFYRLKDVKGLGYVARLLSSPGVKVHVLSLSAGAACQSERGETNQTQQQLPRAAADLELAAVHVGGLGDAGEMLDDQAKNAYRRRISELREELEDAKELGSHERAAQTEAELDALIRELSRAVGLGGRNRRAASASERARQSVTKTIKTVVERIAQVDVWLGDVLSRTIRTGNFCAYEPDPGVPIVWDLAADDPELAKDQTAPTTFGTDSPLRSTSDVLSPAVSFTEQTAFVGRETEVRCIGAAIDRALAGSGSVVMLAGGPGVGKTRLASEMADYASRRGFRSMVGRCYERDEPFPYLPFAEITESSLAQAPSPDEFRQEIGDNAAELAQIVPSLRRVFSDIEEPIELPAEQRRRYLFQSLSQILARVAQTQPRLFVLDDLQWADESTLALLVHLASRISQTAVVIIATYRDEYTDQNPALSRTQEELLRLGIRPVRLSGMSREDVAQMLEGLARRQPPQALVNAIFEESQGYPFFVEEVYRHLFEEGRVFDASGEFFADFAIDESDVPEHLRLIINRRLARFDPEDMRVLAAAAVIGRSFSFRLLTTVCKVEVDLLFAIIEKAQQMGIIVPSVQGHETLFTFAHELVRQTVVAGISVPRQQQLHLSVADAIERLYSDSVKERAGEIANHLLKAKSFAESHRLVHFLTLAGKNALDVAAFDEAKRNFNSALQHPGAVGAVERADLMASLAMAEYGALNGKPHRVFPGMNPLKLLKKHQIAS